MAILSGVSGMPLTSVQVVLLVGRHDEEAAAAPSAPAGELDARAERLDFELCQSVLVEDPPEAGRLAKDDVPVLDARVDAEADLAASPHDLHHHVVRQGRGEMG